MEKEMHGISGGRGNFEDEKRDGGFLMYYLQKRKGKQMEKEIQGKGKGKERSDDKGEMRGDGFLIQCEEKK